MELMKTKKLHPLVNQDFKKETCEAVQNLKADLIFCRKYIYNTGPQRTPHNGGAKYSKTSNGITDMKVVA